MLATAVLGEVIAIIVYTANRSPVAAAAASPGSELTARGNTETVGWLLYTDYLIPFEVASVLLLVAMIGAILLARREA